MSIIINETYLNPNVDISGYPHLFYKREEQWNQLSQIKNHKRIKQVWGYPGTGKTQHLKLLMKELVGVVSYVNCRVYQTRNEVYRKIWSDLIDTFPQIKNQYPSSITIHEILSQNTSIQVYIIIDEIDIVMRNEKAQDQDFIIHEFTRLTNDIMEGTCKFIFISSTIPKMSEQVLQMVRNTKVNFGIYKKDELTQILKLRAEACLIPNSFTIKSLEDIAQFIITEFDGNSRDAIILLEYIAAQSTEHMPEDKEIVHLFTAFKQQKMFEEIHLLPQTCFFLLGLSLHLQEQFTVKDIYTLYKQRLAQTRETPKSLRQVQNHLTSLMDVGVLTNLDDKKRPKKYQIGIDKKKLIEHIELHTT